MDGKRYKIAASLIFATVLFGAGAGRGSDAFVAGVTDLPLMPGLHPLPEATLIFDKPNGRIVQAAATGAGSRDKLWEFYDETLPQLGWHRRGPAHFTRDGERLRITVEKNDSQLPVRFAMAPGSE